MGGLSELHHSKYPAIPVKSVPPFVGRRQQLDWLQHCLQDASAGHPRVVLIPGEAGIGKTRFLKEVQSDALRRSVQVCYGRCYEDLALPYLPFVESLLVQLAQLPEDVTRALGADAEVIHCFLHRERAALPVAGPSISGQADQGKLRLLVAVARATVALAQRCTTLLVVDDLHWADPSSLDLLGHLVFTVADTAVREPVPLLILGTYRPEAVEARLAHLLARLQREHICQTLELPGLDEAELRELIQSLGLVRPSQQLVATISAATQGNPLFIQEVVYHLRQRGTLQERGGYLVTTTAAADLQLPEHVMSALVAHTQGLSEGCRRLLTLAAFLGDHLSLRVLSAVSGRREEEVLDVLDEGLHQHLLLSEGQAFRFAHPLIRHVFYHAPGAVRRQRLHQQIAQALESLYADSLEAHLLEIAHHLIRAGPAAEAHKVVQYARAAGDQAFTVFAWGDAARYYEAALAAARSTAHFTPQDLATLHYRTGLAYYRDQDVGPCLDHYEKAIEVYRLLGDMRGLAQALVDKTRTQFTLAAVPYGTLVDVQPLEEVLKALGESEPELRGSITAIMAEVYWHAKQPDKSEEMARQTLEIGQRIKDDRLCFYASHGLALAHMQSLHVQEALESWQHALAYAHQANDLWLQGWPLARMSWALTALGRLDEAAAVALESCAWFSKIHNWGELSLASAPLVSVAVARGDFEAAERHAQEVMLMLQRSHYPWGGVVALYALACARALRGAWAAAEEAIDMLVEPGRVFMEAGPSLRTSAQVYRHLLHAYSGAVEEEPKQFGAFSPEALGQGRVDTTSLARLCALVEISDHLAAPALVEHLYQVLFLAVGRGVVFSSSGWMFLIPRILGVAATLNRWWDKAEAHFQAAIAVATAVGARPELGRTYLDYARMLAARGARSDYRRAVELVGQASPIFTALGMQPFSQRALQLARALQDRQSPGQRQRTASPDNLSKQEVEVFLRIARSRTGFLG
jgi:tetratricopeptide (TPR) repeat protein